MFRWPEDPRGQLAEIGSPARAAIVVILFVPVLVMMSHRDHNFWVYLFSPIAVLVFSHLIWKKMHPFHIPFFMYQKNLPLSEWDDARLKVLSYLASSKAKRLLRRTERMIAGSLIFVGLTECLIRRSSQTLDVSIVNDSTLIDALGSAFVYVIFTWAMQFWVVFGWALRHFDEIQRSYPPWPKDVPFDTTKPPASLRLGKIGDAPLGDTS